MATELALAAVNRSASIREIIVEHYPYRSRAKNKARLPYWMGNERHASLAVFLRSSNEEIVFLRRITGLDGAKVSWKKAMIKEVYRELIDLVLTLRPVDAGNIERSHPVKYELNTILPDWMTAASYRQLKEYREIFKKK